MATDPDGDTLTYSATGLPPGLSINATTGVISGTLPFDAAGAHRDGVGGGWIADDEPDLPLDGHEHEPAPVVTAPADQTSAEGAAVTLAIVASDPDGDVLTFSATGLPPA